MWGDGGRALSLWPEPVGRLGAWGLGPPAGLRLPVQSWSQGRACLLRPECVRIREVWEMWHLRPESGADGNLQRATVFCLCIFKAFSEYRRA